MTIDETTGAWEHAGDTEVFWDGQITEPVKGWHDDYAPGQDPAPDNIDDEEEGADNADDHRIA